MTTAFDMVVFSVRIDGARRWWCGWPDACRENYKKHLNEGNRTDYL